MTSKEKNVYKPQTFLISIKVTNTLFSVLNIKIMTSWVIFYFNNGTTKFVSIQQECQKLL